MTNAPWHEAILERCAVCGAEEFIPYICRYCGHTHCVYHRLPENHECPNIQQARAPRQPIVLERRRSGTTLRLLQSPRMGVTPRRELVALTAAWIVLGVSFSTRYMFAGWFAHPLAFVEVFLLTMLVIGTGFLGHELAHKFTAQRYGAWAEFKLWTIGAVMTLVAAAVSQGTFIFAAPGAVYIASRSGYIGDAMDRKANGIISLMGPLVNVAAAGILALVYIALPAVGVEGIIINGTNFLRWAIFINLWLGAFNMIPFLILDGQKVLTWNKTVWALVAIPLWLATAAVLFL